MEIADINHRDSHVSPESDMTETVKVFTRNQVMVAAFFGTGLAASYLLKNNYQIIGKTEEATKVFWQGFFTVVALFLFLALLPEEFSDKIHGTTISFFYLGIAGTYFNRNQQETIANMIASGASAQSWWKVLLIILVGLAASLIIVSGLILLLTLLTLVLG